MPWSTTTPPYTSVTRNVNGPETEAALRDEVVAQSSRGTAVNSAVLLDLELRDRVPVVSHLHAGPPRGCCRP